MSSPPSTIRPFCWILNRSKTVFMVDVEDNLTVYQLKRAIVKENSNALSNVDPGELDLWRVPISMSERVGIDDRMLRNKRGNQMRLLEWDALSDIFSQPPFVHESLIIVELPLFAKIEKTRSPSGSPVPRRDTVSGLYERLQKYRLIQVRGTPGSGKTTLGRLMAARIQKDEPNVKVIWVGGWSKEEVEQDGGYLYHLRKKGWKRAEETVFIFDEAQMTYWDNELWNAFVKGFADYNELRAILFAGYGSPTSDVLVGDNSRIPNILRDEQRVTLKAICHNDGLPAVGLLFSKDEFRELISQRYAGPEYYFDESFYRHLFRLTGGHVGALCDLVTVIVADESYRRLKVTGESYTWGTFMGKVDPHDLFINLVHTTIFASGLPQDRDLQDLAVAGIFRKVLADGYVTTDNPEDRESALDTCFINGWLHTDRRGEAVIYFFPSPLHRWWVEWKTWARCPAPAPPIETGDILTFVIDIVKKFSPKRLGTEREQSCGAIQSVPATQYQDEFYRCCSNYDNGSIVTFPEYGTAEGRADFCIPSKEWGVELLCDGDELAKHSGRFSKPGSYTTSLSVKDYIILDCRTRNPRDLHPDIRRLYHVVFSNDFREVSILNNTLVPVETFRLLDPA